MSEEEMHDQLIQVDQRARSNTRRIEKLEEETEAIHSMAASLQVMASEQAHQTEAIKSLTDTTAKLGGKVDALEMKPAKRWEGIVDKIIFGVVGALLAYALAKAGF